MHCTYITALLDKDQQLCRQLCSICPNVDHLSSLTVQVMVLAATGCMPAAHTSVLHYSTGVLHSTSAIALFDKGLTACKYTTSLLLKSAIVVLQCKYRLAVTACIQAPHTSALVTCKFVVA